MPNIMVVNVVVKKQVKMTATVGERVEDVRRIDAPFDIRSADGAAAWI